MVDTEELVIGAVLSLGKISPKLGIKSDLFKRQSCRIIWQEIEEIQKEGGKINILSLYDKLGSKNLQNIGGGIPWISSLTSNVPLDVDRDDFLTECVGHLKLSDDISTDSNLDRDPSDQEIERVKMEIYFEKLITETNKITGEQISRYQTCLRDDWMHRVWLFDPDLRWCYKFDITTASPAFNYDDTSLLDSAIINRLRFYVPNNKITDIALKRLKGDIKLKNRDYNRVYEFTRSLNEKHPAVAGSVLDEFMQIFKFTDDSHIKYYREIFDVFFKKMHLRVQGTQKVNGKYIGLFPTDLVPILQGAQNLGKTTLCQWIACGNTQLYTDLGSGQSSSFGGEQTCKNSRGRLIVEIGELGVVKKVESVEILKSFLSKVQYDFNIKFVEFTNPVPATPSFIGTANDFEVFTDPTGNRRFAMISLLDINKDMLKDFDLIERLHSYYFNLAKSIKVHERFDVCRISDETLIFMDQQRDASMIRYNDHGAIIDLVVDMFELAEMESKHNSKDHHTVTNHEIELAFSEKGYRFKISKNGMRQAMESMGYKYQSIRVKGYPVKGWSKPFLQPKLEIVTKGEREEKPNVFATVETKSIDDLPEIF